MMGRVTINCGSGEESTSVSNMFIDTYMGDANDAQIKVYLYLLRMMSANLPTSVSDIADKFNHTEKDVMRALRYWEKQGLISLEYDGARHLTGIHMEDMPSFREMPAELPPVKQFPVQEEAAPLIMQTPAQTSFPAPAPVQPQIQAPVQNAVPEKPNYTVKQLQDFRQDAHCSQLLYIAEQYFGRTLSVAEMRTILYIHNDLQFSDDLLDYLMQYCIEHEKTDFRYMEKVAIEWDRDGIRTPKQAKSRSAKYDKRIYVVMKSLGMENAPTDKEAGFISQWLDSYGFSMDIIQEACDRTVLSTQKNRLRYADGILRNWHDNGVQDKNDIARLDAAHTAAPAARNIRSSERTAARKNSFNQFQQNDYDFDALEKQLLHN